nr:T9SS type A sorting domain-containing protein [Bacteroidota bacterium]
MKLTGTQSNISDSLGNILFYSNGGWIADATGDTMINGSGLSPSVFSTVYNEYGFPAPNMQIALPFPDSTNQYILIHQTIQDVDLNSIELNYSIIDMIQNNDKGVVVTKNAIALNDTILTGLTACKHANGRDWWIVALKYDSDIIITLLLTPAGFTQISYQSTGLPKHNNYINTPIFSQDGKRMVFSQYIPTGNTTAPYQNEIRLFDFDRCTGLLSNGKYHILNDYIFGGGIAFSPNSNLLYASTAINIYQYDLNAANIWQSEILVAQFDTFSVGGFTDFCWSYLAADGSIYISPCNTAIFFTRIVNPDTLGVNCNVNLHSVPLPCFQFNAHVNHPNYYLGCDTSLGCPCLSANSILENGQHDFRFRVYPNPVVNNFVNIGYILPQNKSGILKLYDVNGKQLYTQGLPPWSNEQSIKLPQLANGIYNLRIESGGYFMSKNLVVMNE